MLRLPAIEVTGTRLDEFAAGQKVRSIDTLTLREGRSLNLGEMLQMSSSVYINTYASNGLSTIAFRGTSVTQTGLFWNGIPMNPPNNGMFDLSLVPSGLFSDIRIYHGGGSALYGSGNIGGSLHLDNAVDFRKHLAAGAASHLASFGQAGGEATISVSDGKWHARTAVIGKAARNDFPYENLQGEEVRQDNAHLGQYGIMQDVYRSLRKGWIIGASFWFQHNRKEIPATLTSKPSDAWQEDRSLRGLLSVKKSLRDGLVSLKSALFHDHQQYRDPDTVAALEIDAALRTLRSVSEAQLEKRVHRNILVSGGIIYTAEKGESDNYEDVAVRQQLGIFALWRQDIPAIGWRLNLNMRQDLVEHFTVPFTPSFGAEGRILPIVTVKMSVSRNFRVPTFNDRYWVPGGNPDLQPERSWNEEVSLVFDLDMEAFRNKTQMTFTGYNSNVDNWILWVPDGPVWSAENIQKVWSRGFEAEYTSAFSIGQWTVRFIGGYTFARSTNVARQGDDDRTYQKQLIYVPEHRYFFTGSLLFRGIVLSYNQSRTGERYVTRDNTEKLPGFTLANVMVSKTIRTGGHLVDLGFGVTNCWDAEYQAVQYYQMPGRGFKVSLSYKFNHFKHE